MTAVEIVEALGQIIRWQKEVIAQMEREIKTWKAISSSSYKAGVRAGKDAPQEKTDA